MTVQGYSFFSSEGNCVLEISSNRFGIEGNRVSPVTFVSTTVRTILVAKGIAAAYKANPPQMNASFSAMASASRRLLQIVMPSMGFRVDESTMFFRFGSGLPIDSNVLRPIMTVLPVVASRKRFMSPESFHGIVPSFPMIPFRETAAMITMSMRP